MQPLGDFQFLFLLYFCFAFFFFAGRGSGDKMDYFSLAFPKAKHEKRIWLPIIYLGDDLRKHQEGRRDMRKGREKR